MAIFEDKFYPVRTSQAGDVIGDGLRWRLTFDVQHVGRHAVDNQFSRGGRGHFGADQAEAFGARNGVPGECVVRLRPTSIAGFGGIADWD